MKLNCEDVARYLSVLTNEVSFRVLKTIPFVGDESITQAEICVRTGYSDSEVGKALRYLTKRELIYEVQLPEDEISSYGEFEEPHYAQAVGGMLGIYLVLAGCMGSCDIDSPDPGTSYTTTNNSTTIRTITEDGTPVNVITNTSTTTGICVIVNGEDVI